MSGTRLSAQDALWLTMDRPTNLMVIDVAVVLGGAVGIEVLNTAFRDLVVRHPVFGRRAEPRGVGWAWVDVAGFDAADQVAVVEMPPGSGMVEVQAHVAQRRSVPFDRSRPLWSAELLAPVTLDDGTVGSVVLTRFHHAIADGVRLTQVMLGVLDPDGAASVPRVARSGASTSLSVSWDGVRSLPGEAVRVTARATTGAVSAVGRGAAGSVRDPRGTAGAIATGLLSGYSAIRHPDRFVDVLEQAGAHDHRVVNDATSTGKLLVGSTPRTVWTGQPGTVKAVAWSPPIPLEDVKQVARRRRATLNDVLVAALAGALDRYLQGRGDHADEVVWMVPVNLKPFSAELPEDLGNHFALVMLDLPLAGADTKSRIAAVRHRMKRIKNSDEPILTFSLQRAIAMSPSRLARLLTDYFANRAVGVLTNVPGPTQELSLDGVPVRQVIGFAPCSGDQPLTATIFTYAGTVTVGFASDAGLVPDPQTLVALVQEELAQMDADLA
jgi:diacylglycerol O-acyltransferase